MYLYYSIPVFMYTETLYLLSGTRLRVRLNNEPTMTQKSVNLPAWEYDPELSQSDLVMCQACRKLIKFWVGVDPELGPTTMDPFSGHVEPDVFRVITMNGGQCIRPKILLIKGGN